MTLIARVGAVRWTVLALLVLLLAAPSALAAPNFPPLTGRVVDEADILPPDVEARLTERLAALEAATTDQVVVVTLSSLQGYEIEDYGYQLGRHWAIGQAGEDNGALLIVAPNERKVRIEVGYGLEAVLTDAMSSVIIQQQVLPRFRDGDMAGGVEAGTEAIVEQLSIDRGVAIERAQAAAASTQAEPPEWLIILIVILIILFVRGWLPFFILGSLSSGGSSGRSWSGGGGSFGGGGFSGGGGSFGGGGASGGW